MNWKCDSIRENSLPPANSKEEFELHQAALDWSLADCIIIQTAEDIQSRVNWRDHLKPYRHQVENLFTFCRRLPVTLLADDVGLGKTISAGLILSELMTRRRVSRALVLCPKILCQQWVEELESKFGIRARVAFGSELDAELAGGSPVVVTTYHSATDRLANIPPTAFDMLVLDEAHKLRNLYGTEKPPKLAVNVRGVLERRLFKFVVMLTATPIQNRIWDLYSLLDCLTVGKGHKNPLGSPVEFRNKFVDGNSQGRKLKPNSAEEFRHILRQYVVRTRRDDARLQFPTRDVRLVPVNLTNTEAQLVRLVAEHIEAMNGFQQISVAQALMSSPQALAAQLENMAERQPELLAEAAETAREIVDNCPEPAKLRQLLFLCQELMNSRPKDWRVVVFTQRKETQTAIGQALHDSGIRVGYIRGGEAKQNQLSIEQLRADPPGVNVLVSTDAGAEGVNLQAANVLINYDLPWNPMIVEQRIGRIQRLASEHHSVHIRNLVVSGSIEETIVARLMEKLQVISQALGDIESILESTDGAGDEVCFEEQIRKLVVKSLLGKDIQQDLRLREESIERAGKLLEEQREVIDQTLGRLDELHHSGPQLPKLERATPTISAQDFVLQSKRLEGHAVSESTPGVFEVHSAGRSLEVITFDEASAETLKSRAVFMGKVRLYQPGKADFERLVQYWVDRAGHKVQDLRQRTFDDAEQLARNWCDNQSGIKFIKCNVTERAAKFQGMARVRAKASNGVDAYEKLISEKFHPQGHDPVYSSSDGPNLGKPTGKLSEIVPNALATLTKTVEADKDIGGFCRFYAARRTEELKAAGDDLRLQYKVSEDFTPRVVGELVSFQGIRYDEVLLEVSFSIQGEGNYQATLRAVPASGQILEQPARKVCGHTKLRVPAFCLEKCQRTGQEVVSHALATSDISGRRGLKNRLVTCQVTGKNVLDDEVAKSTVSGIVALKSEFVTCQKSKGLLLPSEAAKSAMSGKLVRKDFLAASEKPPHRLGLPEEFGTCEVSKKRLLTDEMAQSAVSKKRVDTSLLLPSAQSKSLALPDEMVTCDESGVKLLPSEVARCAVSGKMVDTRLLAISKISNQLALSKLLMKCSATGKLVLPGELEKCEVSGLMAIPSEMRNCAVTNKRVLRSRLLICAQTGDHVLPTEVAKSALSGLLVRRDLLSASEKAPHRLGLQKEFGTCEETDRRLLLDEIGASVVSGKQVDKALLVPSARSGLLAHSDELITCEESGVKLLPNEVARCVISGKLVDTRLLAISKISNQLALSKLLVKCDVTGKQVLPGELEKCEVSGSMAIASEMRTCAESGSRVLRSRLVGCAQTGDLVLPTYVAKSDYSSKVVKTGLLQPSEKAPHRLGLQEEFGICQVTETRLLLDEIGASVVSGKRVDKALLVRSARSGSLALEHELVTCEETGARLLPSEVAQCVITGKLVDDRLLTISEVSGTLGLTRLMVRCEVTGKLALPSELEYCQVTGAKVQASMLLTCSVTNRRALKSKLLLCSKTLLPILATESARSEFSGQLVRRDLLSPSEKQPHRLGLQDEFDICQATGRRLLHDEMDVSAVAGIRVDKELLMPSVRSGKLALASELVTCSETNVSLLPTEVARCAITGTLVDNRLLVTSQVSGRKALNRLAQQCEITQKLALPDELGKCSLTGKLVLLSELKTCSVTGKRGIRGKMVRSEVSGKYAIPEKAFRSAVSGKIGLLHKDECAVCTWLETPILRIEAQVCSLTRKLVSAAQLNDDEELIPLRKLLDGRGGEAADHLIARIRPLDAPFFQGLKHVWVTKSPSGGKFAVCCEIQSWMGMKVRYVGFLLKIQGDDFKIINQGVLGYRSPAGWILESELEFP